MLTHPTSERLIALGFTGMAAALDAQRQAPATFDDLGFEDRLGLLVDHEAAEREARRLTTRLKFAALRQAACVEDLDMRTPAASTVPSWPISSTVAGSGATKTC